MALSVAQQQISISPAGRIEKTFHSLMDGETELVKHHLLVMKRYISKDFTSVKYLLYLLQQAECSNAIPGVSGQGHSLQQAAQGLGQRVHGQSRRDGMKMLFQVSHALLVDLGHIISSPCLLLRTWMQNKGLDIQWLI